MRVFRLVDRADLCRSIRLSVLLLLSVAAGACRDANCPDSQGSWIMSDRKPFPESIELTRLWKKVSQRTGKEYLVGRLAGARITILPNRNKTSDTDADYVVLRVLTKDSQELLGISCIVCWIL
jgi:hypothetical protein